MFLNILIDGFVHIVGLSMVMVIIYSTVIVLVTCMGTSSYAAYSKRSNEFVVFCLVETT